MESLDAVRKYWSVILAVIALVAGFTTIKLQISDQEKRLSVAESQMKILEVEMRSLNPIFLQIQKDLVGIQVSLKFMEQKLDSIEKGKI